MLQSFKDVYNFSFLYRVCLCVYLLYSLHELQLILYQLPGL